jgi:hypothetical protein
MPRKSAKEALQDYLQADYTRWRHLARNDLFCKDLCDYLNNCGTALYYGWSLSARQTNRRWKKRQRLRELHLEKWKIDRVPHADLWPEDQDHLITRESLERWYQAARKESPTFTTVDDPVFMTKIRRGARLDRMFIEFCLDFHLPIDNLVALVEGELRRYYDRYYWKTYLLRTGQHRGKPPSHDFQLKVYDLVRPRNREKPRPFPEVARVLKRPLSTIRDAFHAALVKISSLAPAREMGETAAKEPDNPGPPSECSNIECRNSKTTDEWCNVHKAYYFPEEVPQRDLLVNDLSALEYGLIQKASGRKYRKPTLSSDD